MVEPKYPAARAAAHRVYPHFARHVESGAATAPDIGALQAIVDAAFWASLRR